MDGQYSKFTDTNRQLAPHEEIIMSMNRNEALAQLSGGLRKFQNFTAAQVLASGWAGLNGLQSKDLAYFAQHGGKLATVVAKACQGRSMARTVDPLNDQ
jgi:hypothetical protein